MEYQENKSIKNDFITSFFGLVIYFLVGTLLYQLMKGVIRKNDLSDTNGVDLVLERFGYGINRMNDFCLIMIFISIGLSILTWYAGYKNLRNGFILGGAIALIALSIF